MRALLVNPFIYDFAAYDFWAKPRGLLEVGRLLRQLGWSVEYIDCLYPQDAGMAQFARGRPAIEPPRFKAYGLSSYFREETPKPVAVATFPRRFCRYGYHPDYLRQRLQALESPPDLIGVTGIMTYWYEGVRDTIRILKETFPRAPVLLGGIYPTLLPEHARQNSGADRVFTGLATVPTLTDCLAELRLSSDRPASLPADPSAVMTPSVYYPYAQPAYGITALTEGCRSRCTYCACGKLYPDWRVRPPAQTLAEVRQAADLGCQDFAFYDDDLLLDFDRVLRPFLEQTATPHHPLRFHAANGLALRRISGARAQVMRQYGFTTLRFGFETADETLSHQIGHKLGRREFREKIALLFQAGFTRDQMGVYLLMGLPGQTPEQVADSIRFVLDCGVRAHLAEFSPVPGTVEYERAMADTTVDYREEPFFQNNSLLPFRSRVFTWDAVNDLKNLAMHLTPVGEPPRFKKPAGGP